MFSTDFDVVIIGGGPAGSAAGIYLSRAGIRTAVIERKSFPRETLCGEFLSQEVTKALFSLGLFEKFLELNPNRISSFRFITGSKVFKSDLSFEGFSLQRYDFDNFLLKEAERSGARIFQPAEVKEVLRDKNYFTVKSRSGDSFIQISSSLVLGAFGKSNILDKRLNREFSKIRTDYNGIKFHIKKELLSNIDDSSIYIFSGRKIYCGINTVSRGEVTVCFLDRKSAEKQTSINHFMELINENKYLAALFNNNMPDFKSLEAYGAGSIYFGQKELVKDGIIMIGDAAKVIAPLAGDGIGMAFQSAEMISEIIINYRSKDLNPEKIGNIYKSKWREKFIRRTKIALLVQNILLQNYILNKIPDFAVKKLLPVIISATRK
jgi:menaquinone-9 beta-reductase